MRASDRAKVRIEVDTPFTRGKYTSDSISRFIACIRPAPAAGLYDCSGDL